MLTHNDGVVHFVDASAVGMLVATFFGWLPNIAALLTVFWMALRVYESYLNVMALRHDIAQKEQETKLIKAVKDQVKEQGVQPNDKPNAG